MDTRKEKTMIMTGGLVIGVIAAMLVFFGNPANMGFCIACFLRDTAGALGLHRAGAVQYIRPEIIGLVLGSFLMAVSKKEFAAKGGSSPLTRFILGFFAMIGCLMFFNKGYSLKRSYRQPVVEGAILPVIQVVLLTLLVAAPAFIFFSEEGAGPGAMHAAVALSLIAGLIVGAIAQRTRLCMVGGIRDVVLFRETKLLFGFIAIFISALVCNLILTAVTEGVYFTAGFAGQPIAHTDGLWNLLGMLLVGFACVLLGGCPLRQLILSGEGNSDSAVAVLGLIAGAAFAHNFGLASSGEGPTMNGKIAVVIGIVVVTAIASLNTFKKDKE